MFGTHDDEDGVDGRGVGRGHRAVLRVGEVSEKRREELGVERKRLNTSGHDATTMAPWLPHLWAIVLLQTRRCWWLLGCVVGSRQ